MRYTVLLLLPMFALLACGGDSGELPKDDLGREDFEAFYKKFYADSVFQLSRIEFPMLGTSPNNDGQPFYWTLENWKIIKGLDEEDPDIERQVIDMGEVMQEKIIVQRRFMIQLMYSLINDKWYLTSYSGIRDIAFFLKKQNATVDTTSVDNNNISIENE